MKITNIDPIVNMVLNPLTHEEAAVAGFRVMLKEAARHGGIESMLSRSQALLSRIKQLDNEVVALRTQVEAARRALADSEKARKAITAEHKVRAEQELKHRITNAVQAMINGTSPFLNGEIPAIEPTMKPKTVRRIAASAANKRTPKLRRGQHTDSIVLSLLTNRLKCVSTLFREAQGLGFTGTENTIRFAAIRLTQNGNAVDGHDEQNRIAYRRA